MDSVLNNTNNSSPSSNGRSRQSLQNVLSGFSNPSSFHGYDIPSSGRSHNIYASSFKPGSSYHSSDNGLLSSVPAVHTGYSIHEQTAELANIGVPGLEYDQSVEESALIDDQVRFSKKLPRSSSPDSQLSRLLDNDRDRDTSDKVLYHDTSNNDISPTHSISQSSLQEDLETYRHVNQETPLLHDPFREDYSTVLNNELRASVSIDLENGLPIRPSLGSRIMLSLTNLDKKMVVDQAIVRPASYLPAVFLGVLLNILDGLSYGMIMFPISEATFSSLGPAGLSMFYMSCVISQLVYSLGGSLFKSGIGSEMIEVTPFFHSMALSILAEIGDSHPQSVISTTIFTYAISSIVTGAVFLLLGRCKLGSLVGFFPRHILVGCIGGVGYFLVVTGIEVSSRLEGGIQYNLATFKYLFQPAVFSQWLIPLLLAAILVRIQHYNHNALIVPAYFILVFLVFQALVFIVPSWDLNIARSSGWVFTSPPSNEPWYEFYTLYDPKLVHWTVILRQVPTMFALTFFGILHVPINVPALAVTVGMDEYDVDRELVAHGVSNVLSGLCGSIQNYLVYTNSVLFIRAGADSRLSGVMLGVGTLLVMFAGPVVIGYIPVCVVGALIYLLGYELLKEALYDTHGRLSKFEYFTIIMIVITMGAWDFVYGILVGILLACMSFVVDSARRPLITGVYTGKYARSTVLRHPKQQEFLKDVGHQIYVFKLQGSLFFGSIGSLEKKIRARFENEIFEKEPIKYLVLDMNSVLSMDFSAAECFRRIKNLMIEKDCFLIISSVEEDGEVISVLRDAGLWDGKEDDKRIQLFSDLNSSLEWCENNFLRTYSAYNNKHKPLVPTLRREVPKNSSQKSKNMSISKGAMSSFIGGSSLVGSPRHVQIVKAAKKITTEDFAMTKFHRGQPPLPLIMTVFQGLSNKDEKFWSRLCPFLHKDFFSAGTKLYSSNGTTTEPQFFMVESGLIKLVYEYDFTKQLNVSILPLTAFGDLCQNQHRIICNYTADVDTVVWKLTNIEKLRAQDRELYAELRDVEMQLLDERFAALTSNLIVSS